MNVQMMSVKIGMNEPAVEQLSKGEVILRTRYKNNFEYYAPRCLKIRPKPGSLIPLELNKAQKYLHDIAERQLEKTGRIRALVLKGRQQGVSTYVEGRFYWKVTNRTGVRAFILTHEDKATGTLFEMAQRYHDNCLPDLKPVTKSESAKELSFSALDSGYAVGTAGTKAVGRSSTPQYFHGCLTPDTLYQDGVTGKLVRMRDASVGDLVRTHTGKIAPISFISRKEGDVYSLTLRAGGEPLEATKDHKFLTRNGMVKVSDILVGDCIGYPVPEITGDIKNHYFAIDKTIRSQGGGRETTVPKSIKLDYGFGLVIGLYLAEGCIIRQHKDPRGVSAVTFAMHEKEVERNSLWLKRLDGYVSSISLGENKGTKTRHLTAYGRAFAECVDRLSGSKDEKRLPLTWRSMPVEFVRGMLHGYLSGDGSFPNESHNVPNRVIKATSIRSAISTGMRDAAAALGYGWGRIQIRPARFRSGRNERKAFIFILAGRGVNQICRDLYRWVMPYKKPGSGDSPVEISNGHAWLPVKRKYYLGETNVIDFEVDHEDHSYLLSHVASSNSEVAFWPHADTHATGVLQGVPLSDGTEIFMESTANGIGNYFHTQWQLAEKGESEYIAVFLVWFWQDEYTLPCDDDFELTHEEFELLGLFKKEGLTAEHLNWRRSKISEFTTGGEEGHWRFKQEYPFTASEAFQTSGEESLIDPKYVLAARKTTKQMSGAHVVALDPARFGKDRAAFIHRNGRKMYGSKFYRKKTTMELVGYCVRILVDPVTAAPSDVDMLFIDIGGLGAGIYDRLVELGYGEEDGPAGHARIMGVDSARRALDEDRYANKRAEMGVNMRDWFEQDGGVDIEDLDVLQADFCCVQYGYDSSGRYLLESKDHITGVRKLISPDFFDAGSLTFAEPVARPDFKKRKAQQAMKAIDYHV